MNNVEDQMKKMMAMTSDEQSPIEKIKPEP